MSPRRRRAPIGRRAPDHAREAPPNYTRDGLGHAAGSSGGPVLDRKGNVLGIISWKFAGAEVQGLAFAVPLADAMSSLNINLAPTP